MHRTRAGVLANRLAPAEKGEIGREGQQLQVVGYLLRAKLELGGESCNCYFRTEETTDNHLVVVDKSTVADAASAAANATTDSLYRTIQAQAASAGERPELCSGDCKEQRL